MHWVVRWELYHVMRQFSDLYWIVRWEREYSQLRPVAIAWLLD